MKYSKTARGVIVAVREAVGGTKNEAPHRAKKKLGKKSKR